MSTGQLPLIPDIGEGLTGTVSVDDRFGEVFTRRWIVELILDLVGYTVEEDLAQRTIVEPACGGGAFLGPIVERLLLSAELHGRSVADAVTAIKAFDLRPPNVERARKTVSAELVDAGVEVGAAEALAEGWVREGDFLLLDEGSDVADFVVGNPPYIRLEDVPKWRTSAYRRMCPTMRGRSDVYVGFIEKGLRLLKPAGALGFIVADRWMHNQYGKDLRKLVAGRFSVEAVLEMHEVDAFEDDVSAYPAVTIIKRDTQARAVLATTTSQFDAAAAVRLRRWMASKRSSSTVRKTYTAARLPGWFDGEALWPAGDPECLALVAELERRCPPLQDRITGTRVGIGVATGADAVYLTRGETAVETGRLLPLATAADVGAGFVDWSGVHLVNPWHDGALVDLARYPLLSNYLEQHEAVLRSRYVARRDPKAWYRTIDKVDSTLLTRTKLLLPDLKASIHPVLDDGGHYPHHNLYFVVSTGWNMEVLGGLLLSDIANLFVGTYCVKMRGGCYRFQAQYLRQIRIPAASSISARDGRALAKAYVSFDREAATALAIKLYGLHALPTAAKTMRA